MVYLELAIVAILILLNGALALAELAVISARPARLRALVDRQVVGARRALALASNPGKFLSSVQIGITLIGVLSGAFSGATLGLRAGRLARRSRPVSSASPTEPLGRRPGRHRHHLCLADPGRARPQADRAARSRADRRAGRAGDDDPRRASPSRSCGCSTCPAALVLRLFGQRIARPTSKVTDEEIHTLVAEAETAGVIEPGERAMIAAVMRLGDRPVRAVMTPRHGCRHDRPDR